MGTHTSQRHWQPNDYFNPLLGKMEVYLESINEKCPNLAGFVILELKRHFLGDFERFEDWKKKKIKD